MTALGAVTGACYPSGDYAECEVSSRVVSLACLCKPEVVFLKTMVDQREVRGVAAFRGFLSNRVLGQAGNGAAKIYSRRQ